MSTGGTGPLGEWPGGVLDDGADRLQKNAVGGMEDVLPKVAREDVAVVVVVGSPLREGPDVVEQVERMVESVVGEGDDCE